MLKDIGLQLMHGRKLVLVHGNADPDALGSAYALYSAFPDVTVVAPDGLDRVSKLIAEKLSFMPENKVEISHFDKIVVLDTSSPDQLAPFQDLPDDCIVLDHHARNERWNRHLYYCDESKRSCAEIVYDLLKVCNLKLSRNASLALLAGMLTDSGHFKFATPALLSVFAEIMESSGIEMDEIYDLVDLEQDISERIAQLKGAQRLRFERVGDKLVAMSLGSAFESSVCKSLLTIGADVAFVGSQRGEQFRVSARAKPDLVRQGMHLGKMLEDIGIETTGDGGGHGGAAGLIGQGDVEAILNICVSRTVEFLRTIYR
ncbi:MAG: DHH family phosphoesterase [Methanomassiliicoccales archaeon]